MHPAFPLHALAALALLLSSSSSFAGTNAFWLQPGRTPGGSGSQSDPWIVSQPEDFDARLRAIPTNSVITLLPGVFETYGSGAPGQPGFFVKNGWTVQGAGIHRTTVRLVGCILDQHPGSGVGRVFFSGWGPGVERVVLRDLTVDCNERGVRARMKADDLTLSAVFLMGREHRVERIKAINALGRRTLPGGNPECFVIALSPRDDSTDATGYFVEDCEVSSFAGGSVTAIALLGTGGRNGATGALRRNRVVLGGTGGEFGFSAYGAGGFVIEHNVTRQAARAFNWDTAAPGRDLTIRNNQFLQCTGWALTLGGGGDSIVEDNVIELAGPNALGVQISARNEIFPGAGAWIIRNNTFRARSGTPMVVRFFRGVPVPGCQFVGNRIDPRLRHDPSAAKFDTWRANVDLRNRPVQAPR
ncbi:MAG: right-handed parallel beta-helix repeat-containing protein [Verrucomicrobiae bacterium]|nr:right-handed parallel beta-helix repeat-containing protein [Verrucomicrobiae bacterium]